MTVDVRFPIGRPNVRPSLTAAERAQCIATIEAFPARLRAVVTQLSDAQLDTRYREDGWTVRQVVHHVPDSHMNGYIRFKLTVTEDNPTIRGYEEQIWAELPEAKTGDIELSLPILESVHRRWVTFLKDCAPEEFSRSLTYSDGKPQTLDGLLCIYSWHGEHHLAHITELMRREGW